MKQNGLVFKFCLCYTMPIEKNSMVDILRPTYTIKDIARLNPKDERIANLGAIAFTSFEGIVSADYNPEWAETAVVATLRNLAKKPDTSTQSENNADSLVSVNPNAEEPLKLFTLEPKQGEHPLFRVPQNRFPLMEVDWPESILRQRNELMRETQMLQYLLGNVALRDPSILLVTTDMTGVMAANMSGCDSLLVPPRNRRSTALRHTLDPIGTIWRIRRGLPLKPADYPDELTVYRTRKEKRAEERAKKETEGNGSEAA